MTAKYGLTLSRWATALLAIFALSLGGSSLAAQETSGKVEGTVRDPNDQPVAGAQVLIMGTSFSAQTNTGGYYFINNVPAGTYNVRAQFIGLQPAEIQNVRISAGQTVTVDYDLQGAIALEAIAITTAAQPIIPRDQVTSRAIVSGSDIDQLPLSDPNAIVTLQPGVVRARGGAISIRGGRVNEAAVFIDGAPVRSNRTAGTNIQLSTNVIEELAVTTGALSAEFGDAQSGVISFVTRSGGPSFAGSLAYESDEAFGDAISVGFNRFEASLSGPIIGNLTFFVGGTLQGHKSDFLGKGADEVAGYQLAGFSGQVTQARGIADSVTWDIPVFVQYQGQCDAASNLTASGTAVECQGRRRAGDWTTNARLSGKLQATYGSGSSIALSAHVDRDQNMNTNAFLFESAFGSRSESNVYVLNWVQQLTRGASSALAFDVNVSYQTDNQVSGQLERDFDLTHRDPGLGIVLSRLPFVLDEDHFSDDTSANTQGVIITTLDSDADWDALILNVRTNTGTRRPYLDRLELNRIATPRMNPFAITSGFNNTGINWNLNLAQERRLTARGNVDWQAGRFNRFKFGGEFRNARSHFFSSAINRFSFGDFYVGKPDFFSAYFQDRLDLGDVIVELGFRWDSYNSGGLFPRVPGRIFTNPAYDAANPLASCSADATNAACDAAGAIWRESARHTAFSPRLRASFPITDKTGFRLSYAHQAQTPPFQDIFNGSNNDLANTNTNDRFGGDVDFAKTIMFEFGVRHAFSRDMVLDISAYNKDKTSDFTYRILPFFDPFTDRINNVNVLTNADFGTIRGVDVQLQRRFSNVFSGQVSYTFQNSRSTGSDPQDFLSGLSRQPPGVDGLRPSAPSITLRTRDDRRHNIQGSWTTSFPDDYSVGLLSNVGLFGIFRVSSGLPYTKLQNSGQGNRSTGTLGLVAQTTEPLQASETPWTAILDVRLTKGFSFGGNSLLFYVDARNVLNLSNENSVFSETGDIFNDEHFRVIHLDPQRLAMSQEAIASGLQVFIDKNGELIEAINLTTTATSDNCSGWQGSGGPISCIMLRGAEARFGNGDQIYDVDEQEAALRGWSNLIDGVHTFLGQPRHVLLGVQLDF